MSWVFSLNVFCLQDRLSFIGPEEFIQTFAMKDPLENHKVRLSLKNIFASLLFPSSIFCCWSNRFVIWILGLKKLRCVNISRTFKWYLGKDLYRSRWKMCGLVRNYNKSTFPFFCFCLQHVSLCASSTITAEVRKGQNSWTGLKKCILLKKKSTEKYNKSMFPSWFHATPSRKWTSILTILHYVIWIGRFYSEID